MFLLDTNACIRILNQGHSEIARRFESCAPYDIALCSVVKAELLFGARRSSRIDENLRLLDAFFSPLESLPFDDRCAEHYAILRAVLASQGNPIGPNDLLIAAIALSNDATLVTHNTAEFRRVPGLRIVDWEVE